MSINQKRLQAIVLLIDKAAEDNRKYDFYTLMEMYIREMRA